jgi:hypothetical protein
MRRVGKHSAETKTRRGNLLQPYLYRARKLIERSVNKINLSDARTAKNGTAQDNSASQFVEVFDVGA